MSKELRKLLRERGISGKNANALLKGRNIPYTGYKERMSKRVRDAQKIGKERGEGDVNPDYFFPRRGYMEQENA